MGCRSLFMSLVITTLCLTPSGSMAAVKRSQPDPMAGTVGTVLKRLRANGLCSYHRRPGDGANLCETKISKISSITAHPDRLNARLEAITVDLTVENTDERMPRDEVSKSTRIAVRVIRQLLPQWTVGERWVRRALVKARTSQCIMITHANGYAISVSSELVADYNITNATLTIDRDNIVRKYPEDYCKQAI